MTETDNQWLFLQHDAELREFARINGYKLTGGELQRFPERQEQLVATGKSWTLKSDHIRKCAQDYNIFIKEPNDLMGTGFKWKLTYKYEDIKPLGEFWKTLSEYNYWGGDWLKKNGQPGLDCPHMGRARTKRKE